MIFSEDWLRTRRVIPSSQVFTMVAKIAVKLGYFFTFSNGTDNNTKVFRLDGLNKAKKAFSFLTTGDFLGNAYGIGKWYQHQVSPGQG